MVNKILGLIATIVALCAVVGASAPSQIMLQTRSASVPLINTDEFSLIAVRKHSTLYDFISYDGSTGKFVLTVQVGSIPLNPFSENWFDGCIDLFNQGVEAYRITISSSNSRVQFYAAEGMWWGEPCGRDNAQQTLTSKPIPAGWSWRLGVYVDATGLATGQTISATITITAVNP